MSIINVEEISEEDVPPPLEDMTQELSKRKQQSEANRNVSTDHERQPSSRPKQSKQTSSSVSDAFGFKKGFLNAKPAVSSKKTKSFESSRDSHKVPSQQEGVISAADSKKEEDVPYLKARVTDKQEHLVFPEVQDAVKAAGPLLSSSDWITDDLLKRIESNPRLSGRLSDPKFGPVIEQLQSNPGEAIKTYASDPEMRTFLEDFCALMGEHFSSLADKEETEKSRQPQKEMLIQESSDAALDKEAKELMIDPKVREALLDPVVQRLIQELRDDPVEAQMSLQNASSQLKQHIHLLVSKGILELQK